MNAEKILKFLAVNDFDGLKKEAIAEIAIKDGGDYAKARIALAKETKKMKKEFSSLSMIGCYIDGENGKQCICNGFAIAEYNDIQVGLENEDCEDKHVVHSSEIDSWGRNKATPVEIDLNAIRSVYKVFKATSKEDCYIQINDGTFNTKYVIGYLSTIKSPAVSLYNQWFLFFEGENGKGVVLGIRNIDNIKPEQIIYKVGT